MVDDLPSAERDRFVRGFDGASEGDEAPGPVIAVSGSLAAVPGPLAAVNAKRNRPGVAGLHLGLGYAAMIAVGAGAFALIRAHGLELSAPAPTMPEHLFAGAPAAGKAPQVEVLGHLLLALLVITVVARGLGRLFQRFHQPPVIGEIVGGILLGPSLLGRVAPEAQAFFLPGTVAPFLGAWSQVGAILFMFLVGIQLDPTQLRGHGKAALAISHTGIVVPFLLGSLLALFLYPILSSSAVPFTAFSLFMGVSMSVTAFPVLARILTDRQANTSRIGALALTCAAADDLTAWCLLAVVIGVVQAHLAGAAITAALSLGFVLLAVFVVKPLMVRLTSIVEERGKLTQGMMGLVLFLLLGSAAATDAIGIHTLIGAFVLGVTIPHQSRLARELVHRLEDLVVVLFLPAYFAFTGMRTEIGLIGHGEQWLLCGLIVGVASLGKFGGVTLAARLSGIRWRDSAALGILMNTRGLMEFIVLNIGYDLGVISPTLFAMLVVMAVLTTLTTTPIFHVLSRAPASG